MTYSPAFWSHADVSQSAASAAGSEPPITNPKNRGPALAMSPPSALAASASTTATGSSPCSGSGPPKPGAELVDTDRRADRPFREARDVLAGELGGALEGGIGGGSSRRVGHVVGLVGSPGGTWIIAPVRR